jgi:hypothetical protein
MFRTVKRVVVFLVAASCLAGTQLRAESLANRMPSGALVFAELSGLQEVLTRIQKSDRLASVLNSDYYQQIAKTPDIAKAFAGKALAEAQIGMDLWDFAKTIVGGKVAVGVYPREGRPQPDAVVILETNDVAKLDTLKGKLQPWINLAGQAIRQTEQDGIKLLDVDGKAFVAMADGWIIAASTKSLLDETLKISKNGEAASVATDETFKNLTTKFGAKHHLQVMVDTQAVSKMIGRRAIPAKLDEPIASLLFGGITELLANTSAAGFTIDLTDDSFLATLGISAGPSDLPAQYQPFFSKPDSNGTRSFSNTKGLIGGFSFYRELGQWYQKRDELVADKALPGFDKFEAGIGNLLPGRDFGTDVLPAFGPTLTFLAAHQNFDHLDGEPGIKLPGFALVVDLAKPDQGETLIQLFYQTLTSLLNIQAGQQGRQPWIMASEVHNGATMTFGKYLQKPDGDRLPFIFNFMPAAARVGDRYVLSSSISVCRQLIDDLQKPAERVRANRNLHFELQGKPLAESLSSNEQALIAQGVREGKPAAKAKSDIELFVQAVKAIESIRLTTRVEKDAFRVEFEGKLVP